MKYFLFLFLVLFSATCFAQKSAVYHDFVLDANIRSTKISLLINEKSEDEITEKEIDLFYDTPAIKHSMRFHKALSFDGTWKLATASFFFN